MTVCDNIDVARRRRNDAQTSAAPVILNREGARNGIVAEDELESRKAALVTRMPAPVSPVWAGASRNPLVTSKPLISAFKSVLPSLSMSITRPANAPSITGRARFARITQEMEMIGLRPDDVLSVGPFCDHDRIAWRGCIQSLLNGGIL